VKGVRLRLGARKRRGKRGRHGRNEILAPATLLDARAALAGCPLPLFPRCLLGYADLWSSPRFILALAFFCSGAK
jgi:hypothetical protein